MVKSMRPGCQHEDLDHRMRMMDDLNRAKLRRHRRSPITELYDAACFSARRPPNLFRTTVAQGPIPPVLDITIGVKVALYRDASRATYVLGPPPSRGGNLMLEGGVNVSL